MIPYKFVLFLLFTMLSLALFSQEDDLPIVLAEKLDSIKNNISDIEKRNSYYEILKDQSTGNPRLEIIAFQAEDNIFDRNYFVARSKYEYLLEQADFSFLEKHKVHYFLGYIYLIRNELRESIEFYNIVLSSYTDERTKSTCKLYVASIYHTLNEYELALDVLEQATVGSMEYKSDVFLQMALTHSMIGNIDKTKIYLDSASINITSKAKLNVLKFTKANIALRAGRFHSAVEKFQEIIDSNPKATDSRVLNNLSLAYQRINDKRAISSADSALVLLRMELDNKPYHFEYSVSYQNKAEYYSMQGLHELSINLIDSAIYNHCYGSSISGSPINYIIDPVLVDDKASLVEFLDVKIGILKTAKDSVKLERTYWMMDTLIQAIREERYDDQGRYFQQSQLSKYYKDAVHYFMNAGKIRTAYLFTQKMKNIILLENRHFRKANSILSDSLRRRIDFLMKGINNLASQEFEGSKKDSILFEIEKKKLSLINTRNLIKKENPNYHGIRFQESSAQIGDLQKACKENQLLIDYYLEDSLLHIFTISKDEFSSYSQELDAEFLNEIQDLILEISRKPTFLEYTGKESEELTKRLNILYEFLIPFSIKEYDQLLIFPSEEISYLPLETLVNRPASRACPYLVCSKAMSYSFSPQLWLLTKAKDIDGENNTLIFSPHQSAENSELYLPNAKSEAENIAGVLKSTVETKCEKDSFFTLLQSYNVHHLLSHAIIDLANPKKSFFHMGNQVDSISMEDILTTNLESKMVCLSACDTGNGKYAQGEGIISLARSFMVSGASSVVMSNFEVSDHAGSKIMANFYKNLSNGMNKSDAISNSKKDYLLSESSYRRHPYFWSSFTLQGNESAIVQNGNKFWKWLLISTLAILIFFVVRKSYSK